MQQGGEMVTTINELLIQRWIGQIMNVREKKMFLFTIVRVQLMIVYE